MNIKSAIVAVLAPFAGIALMVTNCTSEAQVLDNHGWAYTGAIPYRGTANAALAAANAGTTIPMAKYAFTASNDGLKHTNIIVGSSPLARVKTSTTINFLIVPVIVHIGGTTFDPAVNDSCIGTNTTPLAALQQSPLVQNVVFDGGTGSGHAATMNGVNVGTTTYPDAFRGAEFWSKVQNTSYHVLFNVITASPWTITASEVQTLGGGNVLNSSCAQLGVLPTTSFPNYIQNTVIPAIPALTPTTFPIFLLKDVMTTTSSALHCFSFCGIGYHAAFGSPVQTYAVSEYDSTRNFWNSAGIIDISILAHEVGEWMDDPLVKHPTPAWGGIGQLSGCQTNWEVGDPLTGTNSPAITMSSGVAYSPQKLAFWSWYYNGQTKRSTGAGGKFSSHGTFKGPSKPCPPGGTY